MGGERVHPYGPMPDRSGVLPRRVAACFLQPGPGASGLPERRRRSGCILLPRPLRVFGPRSRRKPELAGRASFNAVAGTDFCYRSLPWGRRIRFVSEAGGALRDQPASLQVGSFTVCTATGRRRYQIVRLAPTIFEASPVWLAFATGPFGLAPRPGINGLRWLNLLRTIRIAASCPGVPRRRLASAFPRPGYSTLRPFRAVHTAGPAVAGDFRSRFQRIASNLRSGEPFLGLGPRSAVGSCEPQQSKRLSVHLQPEASPVPDSDQRSLSETSTGPSRSLPPAFIDSRIGLSHQPNISVRVCIPLARLAGG